MAAHAEAAEAAASGVPPAALAAAQATGATTMLGDVVLKQGPVVVKRHSCCMPACLAVPRVMARPPLPAGSTARPLPRRIHSAATRVAILAQKASIERQELQLRVRRLKRSRSSAREGAGGDAPAAAAPAPAAAPEAAAGSSTAAGQQVQEEEGMAPSSPLAAVHGRLDQPEQAE